MIWFIDVLMYRFVPPGGQIPLFWTMYKPVPLPEEFAEIFQGEEHMLEHWQIWMLRVSEFFLHTMSRIKKKKIKKSSFWIEQFVTFNEIISALCLAICFKMIEIISFYLLKRVQYCNRNILSCENAKFLSDLQLFKTLCF